MRKSIRCIKLLLFLIIITYPKSEAVSQVFASLKDPIQENPSSGKETDIRPLKDALTNLEKEYKVVFNYNSKIIEGKLVNIKNVSAAEKTLKGKLQSLLEPLDLTYEKVEEGSYVIYSERELDKVKKKSYNFLNDHSEKDTRASADAEYSMSFQPLQTSKNSFDLMVKGKVQDNETGEGLPGVSVVLKGTTIGSVTDVNGEYSLNVPDEKGVLVFSFIGYTSEEVPVNNNTVINVSLLPSLQSLSEIVVVGYGSQKKKDLTGSVATVNADEIKSLPVASVSEAMQGRAAGVQVVASGVPGADAIFRIRGTSTMNNNDPLLVIDGVPVGSGLNTLNPDDIESLQVLKDASAAAIYGSRAANGVVIVTTKRGKGAHNKLDFNFYTAGQQATNVVEMLNASQFATLHNEMMTNNGQPTNPAYGDPASLGKGTDWLDGLLRYGRMQNYSLSYAGSSDNSNYYVSGNILNQDGIVINTGYKRYTIQFNSDHKLFDRLKFGNNLTLNHDVKKSGAYNIRNAMAALPGQAVFNPDGTYSGPTGQANWYGDITNPIGQARLIENSTLGYNVIGSVYGELEILKNLRFRSNVGLQANFWDRRTWSPKYDWKPIPNPNSFLFREFNKALTWLWDNTLTYEKYFGDHHLTVLAGTSAQSNRYDVMSGSKINFASDVTQELNNGNEQPSVSGTASEWALMSYIGRLNYSFKDKYLLTATVRRDGSSRFGAENRYGTFPSASVAWRISEENFFKGLDFVNDLKIRGGYGLTGNQEIGNYTFAATLQTMQYNFNNQIVSGVIPRNMPNPNVQWEAVEQTNIGFDATLFKERVNITLDGYVKNTTEMLVRMAVPISTGYSDITGDRPYINAGKMQNRGVELTVSTDNLTGPLKWNTNFNVSYNQNKLVKLNDTIPMPSNEIGLNQWLSLNQSGQPVGAFYGFITDGVFQNEGEVDRHATQIAGADPNNRTSAGDIRFKDLNDDGKIDDEDRTFIGNPNPKFIFAMNNTFAYKGIDLSIFLQGVSGNDIFNANRIWQEGMAVAQNQTTATLDRWQGEGTSTSMPRAVYNDPNKNTRVSDRFIEDGSYFRIKNISIGYTIPQEISKRFKVSSLRIYASGQNLYTFTSYTGFDPEVGVSGIDNSVYPVTRTYSVGMNLSF
ncbi:MAG TPA: TonB-dependent receptor [Cytophagales bacterium]|nr:TonB-dependent receptor [Cytophagales bacterium]